VSISIKPLPALAQLRQETEAFFRGNGRTFRMSKKAIVAYIRHNRTNYHQLLTHMPGATVAYLILRGRVNQKIRAKLKEAGDE
jgi:hypothetical protein